MSEKEDMKQNNETPTPKQNPLTNEISNILTNGINRIFNDVLWGFWVSTDKKIHMTPENKDTCIQNWKILKELIQQAPLSITYDQNEQKFTTTRNKETYVGDLMGNKELENRLKEGASLIINFKNNVFNFDYNGNRYERDEEDEEILKTYYNNDEYKNPESGIRLPENSNKHRENPTFESATLLSGLSKLIWWISHSLPKK